MRPRVTCGRGAQRVDHGEDRERQAGLAQITVERPQPVGLARFERRAENQAIEDVVLGEPVEHGRDRQLDGVGPGEHVGRIIAPVELQFEVVHGGALGAGKFGRQLRQHAEAEILERRHRVGQRHRAALLVDLEAQFTRRVAVEPVEAGVPAERAVGIERGEVAQAFDVARRFRGAEGAAIALRESLGIARGERGRAARLDGLCQLALDGLAPAAQHRLQAAIDPGLIGRGIMAAKVEHVAEHREVAAFDDQAPVERLGPGFLDEQSLHLRQHFGREGVARQPNEGEQVPRQRRRDELEARARAVG